MTATPAQQRGAWGEELAARAYRRAGYQILDRNWRIADGELDLVVATTSMVVFVEVKARANDRYGGPAVAVGAVKQRRIRRLAAQWLAGHDIRPAVVRFDVAAVTGTSLEIIEAAF